ncbi:MAG TPA: hypothetical protein VMP08_03675 [Anaerolineae bacterium]|nr:hypothetical protein [Anaerolineae bacterium]
MFKKRTSSPVTDLLPWYLNRTLPAADQPVGAEQARQAPQCLASWQAVRSAALSQPTHVPPLAVRQRVLAQTRAKRTPRWLPLLSGVILAVLALVLLWNVVQPGIGLQWSVDGPVPAAFRIYRAPVGSQRFEFVREVPAQAGITNYTYVDTTLWPGQTYQYRVEAVSAEMASATIAANGDEVLPTQLAIVFSSLLIGLAGAYVLREMAILPKPAHWKPV